LLATTNYLKQSSATRRQSKGVLESSAGTNIPRGAAWALRTLAQAAAITPDSDPLRAQFVNSLSENVLHYHAKYVAKANNPLGLVQPYDHLNGTDPWTAQIWMDDFFTASFGYLGELAVTNSAVQTQLQQFLAFKFKAVVGRLGGSGTNQFSYRYAAQYSVPFAPSNSSNWETGAGPWYSSWGDVARAMGLATTGNTGESLDSGYPTEATGYWSNLMPALSYAVDFGATGAADAWTRVTSASNFPTQAARYNDEPVWGVKPRTR
jgi:hypothetical protein